MDQAFAGNQAISALSSRVTALEDTYVRTLWFEQINSGTSGNITPPTGSSIVLDQWAAGVDAVTSTVTSGQRPDFVSAKTAAGAIITATMDGAGAWTISGTPSSYPIAIIYVYEVQLKNFNRAYSLVEEEVTQATGPLSSPTFADITDTGLSALKIVVSDASKKLASGTNTDADVASAVSLKHTQGSDTALGTVGTKNPPIDADLAMYRDSANSNALVTSTWTQIKAFLKTYFDTIYHIVGGALGTPASGDLQNCSLAVAPAIGGTTPNVGDFTRTSNKAPTAVSSFAGTISASGTTATFTQAADYNLCRVGSTIISNAQTRYVCKLLGSNQVTLDQSTTWAGSSTITSIQDPQYVSDSNGTSITFVAANGSITTVLTSDGSILFHRTVDGKEGIGTTGPTEKLDIFSVVDGAASNIALRGPTANNPSEQSSVKFYDYNANLQAHITGYRIDGSNGGINIYTNLGAVDTLTASFNKGNVGIGTTDFDGTPAVGQLTVKGSTTDGSTLIFVGRDSAEVNQITINTDGDVKNTNNSYGALSDEKLKENIRDATDKLSDLLKVRVRHFNLKDNPDLKQIGMIAQELEQVFPGLISSEPDMERVPDPDWKPSIKKRQVIEKIKVEQSKTEIVEEAGKYIRKTIIEIVTKDNPLFDTVPLYNDAGELLEETHQIPRMEEYTETEEDRPMILRPTGTVTKSIKYSVFVPILIKAFQELAVKVAILEGKKK